MARKFKSVKVTEQGNMTDMKGTPIACPIRECSCNARCAWFSHDVRIVRCKDVIIGVTKGKSIRSFHLSIGPPICEIDEI